MVKFVVNPSPITAKVIINGQETKEVDLPRNTEITFIVSALFFKTHTETFVLKKDTEVDIMLEELPESSNYTELKQKMILSQYANSPRLLSIIKKFAETMNVAGDTDSFYSRIYNIMTAGTYGLNIWGTILNIPRQITTEKGEVSYLNNELYRFLLLLKAMSNISNCTIPNLEDIFNELFKDRGTVKIFDIGTMEMKYIFDFYLTDEEKAILKLDGVPPKPTGVKINYKQIPSDCFGFHDTGYMPFNQGTFRNEHFLPDTTSVEKQLFGGTSKKEYDNTYFGGNVINIPENIIDGGTAGRLNQ